MHDLFGRYEQGLRACTYT